MKKKIVCLAIGIVFACAAVCSAQVTGGVKGGINFANMSLNGGGLTVSPGNRTAWTVGAFVDVPVAKQLAFQPEVLYARKGAATSLDLTDIGGTSATATIKLDYIDVPLLFRVDVPTRGTVVPYAYAGPNVGFLLSAKAVATASGGAPQEQDIKSDTRSTDFGIAFGGGVRFGRMLLDARYVMGLQNIVDSPTANESAKNHVFKILFGVRF